ncbi:MAG: gamma-glutamyltransferase, partial [Gemmatimonadaceae bacterium]
MRYQSLGVAGAAAAAALIFTPAHAARQDAPPVQSTSGMVVSVNGYASDIGAMILAKGGNAVDAAVATGFALAVVHPAAGN